MTPQRDEVRDLIRAALDQGVIPDDDGVVEFEGQSIKVTHLAGERIRFDLPRASKALELIGSRLFERDYDATSDGAADPLDEPLDDVDDDRPEDTPALATIGQVVIDEPMESANSAVTNHPADPATTDPNLATQLDYQGNPETVDTRRFPNRIICACGNIRWVKNADLFQIRSCKPCVQQGRRERRQQKAKAKRAAKGGNGNTSPS